MTDLKRISVDAIPRALELAERYRLLNEPEQAASICHDILAIDAENFEARRNLFLAITEQFGRRRGTTFQDAERIAQSMATDYEKYYYAGMACERWARAKLQEGSEPTMVSDWLHRAMASYEKAEGVRPVGNDDAVLRWNACARLIQRVPELLRIDKEHEPGLWD